MQVTRDQAKAFLRRILEERDLGIFLEGVFGNESVLTASSLRSLFAGSHWSDDTLLAEEFVSFLHQVADHLADTLKP